MKTLFIILFSLFLAEAGKAQQPISKEDQVNNLSKTLSVDKKRAEEIKAALDYNIEKIRSTARDTSISPQEKRVLIKQLDDERQAKIKAILTPEQMTMFQARLAEHQQAQQAKMKQRRAEQQQKLQERAKAGEKKEDIKQ